MTRLTEPRELAVNGVTVPFAEGTIAVSGVEVTVASRDVDGGRRLDLVVRNRSRDVVDLDEVTLRIDHLPDRVLEHGYQSWSVVRRCSPGDWRPERAEQPDWVRGSHGSSPEAAGRCVSGDQFLLMSDGVAGFLGGARHFGTIECREDGLVVRALLDGVPLAPAEERVIEPLWLADGEPGVRYSDFASLWGLEAGARIGARSPLGWCSWYQYFADVRPEDLRATLAAIVGRGFDLVQIDDGYQAAVGDWLRWRDGWDTELPAIAHEIRHRGLDAGLWTAPFLAAESSELLREHPDWTTTHTSGHPSRAAYNDRSWGGWAFALDTTRPEVLDHLRNTFSALCDLGFDYHKIDFCYAAALPARRHDPTRTRAEALRSGLEAVRDGVGDHRVLLGCGCPFGPAVGVVDAMRVSADVAPSWEPAEHWPGYRESAPAAVNAIAASVLRAPMHRRLFINDPDCLLLRPERSSLDARQRSLLAAVITGAGAFTVVSDDVRYYTDAEWGLFEALRSVHDDVDTLLDIDDPFADVVVVRSAAGTTLTVDWRDGGGGPTAQLGVVDDA